MAMVADENGNVASDVGYCHACEWRRERGRATRSAMGKGTMRQPDERALGKGQTDEQPRRAMQGSRARGAVAR
jgi:hypothetical protein